MTRPRDHEWGFYQPALQEAIRYWRITGFFMSQPDLQALASGVTAEQLLERQLARRQ